MTFGSVVICELPGFVYESDFNWLKCMTHESLAFYDTNKTI